MSSIGAVIESYKEGIKARDNKNYLRAARYFRICYYNFEYGELPVFNEEVLKCGQDSSEQYYYCKSKLKDEAKRMLERERREHKGDWLELVIFTENKIIEEQNLASPNIEE